MSVEADGVPLEKVLSRFAALVDMRVWLQPGIGDRIVTVSLDALPLAEALRRVLVATEVDFVLTAGTADTPMRLTVGDLASAVEIAPATAGGPVAAEVHADLTNSDVSDAHDIEASQEEHDINAHAVEAAPHPAPANLSEKASAARLVQLLAPVPQPKPAAGTLIALPFPGPDGQPLLVPNDAPPPGIVRLPFPDALGQPLEVVVPILPAGSLDLPFPAVDVKHPGTPVAPRRSPAKPPGRL